MRHYYRKGEAIPRRILRPVPDDGKWRIVFGRDVDVVWDVDAFHVRPATTYGPLDEIPLARVERVDDSPCGDGVVLHGGPTCWYAAQGECARVEGED